jgi:hypothetical protein
MTGTKCKGTDIPIRAMNAYSSRGIDPLILNLGTRWGLSGLTPRPDRFTPGQPPPPATH